MKFNEIWELIETQKVKFIDLRFTDTLGKEHHLTIPTHALTENLINYGQPFDGSSISGWQGIESSDMLLKPDLSTAKIDPFYEQNTLFITCDVFDPVTQKPYHKCPRNIAKKAEEFLKTSKIADVAYFGPEPEFFVFDSVTWDYNFSGSHVKIVSEEAEWSSGEKLNDCNLGHRPSIKGGYFPVPPVDSLQNLRSDICSVLENIGIPTEVHHHEVATAGQCEVGTKFSTMVQRSDWSQLFKYVVKNVANRYGKTATFMPKPIVGDNGSGMHIHQSIWQNGKNLFAGSEYGKLSQTALYYIGGIIKHAQALNAITNPTTNSYKRLIPGFEAPTILTYSSRNRSASIRIPYSASENGRRIEVRFPDPMCNPYLAFATLLMAGIDGIINKIDPKAAMDINLYELSKNDLKKIPQVCSNLETALKCLDSDREFLLRGDVFTNEFIDSYINLKEEEIKLLNVTTHPVEFAMYYSL